jgi:Flp pilus assembly protein TadD
MHASPSDTCSPIYLYTYELHRQGRLDEAESLFRLLLVYDVHNVDYALALGAVYQLREEYDRAIRILGMAHALGGTDHRPLLHAGKCNLLAHRPDAARACLEMLLAQSADDALLTEARACLASLDRDGGATAEGRS